MSSISQSSPFKYAFWGLLFLLFIAFSAQASWVFFGGIRSITHILGGDAHGPHVMGPTIFVPRFAIMSVLPLIYVLVVSTTVYKDARRRGLDPWLWATVATFVPFFLGIVAYLVMRSNGSTICEQCGRTIRSEYKICPYCGRGKERACPRCGNPVAGDWKVCPHCEQKLTPAGASTADQDRPTAS
jgi:RNA polymerase subunit RPABC4/transcription elongation factor Spt4